jgi:hypothetical protein
MLYSTMYFVYMKDLQDKRSPDMLKQGKDSVPDTYGPDIKLRIRIRYTKCFGSGILVKSVCSVCIVYCIEVERQYVLKVMAIHCVFHLVP